MKTVFTFVVALLCAVPSFAQFNGQPGSFPGCKTCGVTGYIDLPREADDQNQTRTVSASDFQVVGWGFEMFSGHPIDRVDVFYQDYDTGRYHPLKQNERDLWYNQYRGDVRDYHMPWFPHMDASTGFVLFVNNPPPLGLRRMEFNLWYGPYFITVKRTYLIVP